MAWVNQSSTRNRLLFKSQTDATHIGHNGNASAEDTRRHNVFDRPAVADNWSRKKHSDNMAKDPTEF